MIGLVKRGTTQTDQEGLVNMACTPERTLEGRYVLKECITEKGILPCVGWGGVMETKPYLV